MRFIAGALLATATLASAWFESPPDVAQTQPMVRVSPTLGRPGDAITITGSGFPSGEIVGLYFDTPTFFLDAPGPRADAQGNFTDKVNVTTVKPGIHSICGDTAYPGSTQPVAAKACTSFTVLSAVSSAARSPNSSPITPSTPPVPLPIIGLAILIALVGVTAALFRGRK